MLKSLDEFTRWMWRRAGARVHRVATTVGEVEVNEVPGRGEGDFLLLHGMGTTATGYTAVVRRLQQHAARVLLPDLPGHGQSTLHGDRLNVAVLAAGLREALDQLVPPERPVVLLGTSLGGAAALRYTLERPNRIRALVLASPAGAPMSDEELAKLRTRFDLRTAADARRFFGELLHRPPWFSRLLERGLVEQLAHPRVRGFLDDLGHGDFMDAEMLKSLEPPTTVIWGQSDRVLPQSGLAYYRRHLPSHVRFIEPTDVGHSPHFERPGLIADELLAAWSRGQKRQ